MPVNYTMTKLDSSRPLKDRVSLKDIFHNLMLLTEGRFNNKASGVSIFDFCLNIEWHLSQMKKIYKKQKVKAFKSIIKSKQPLLIKGQQQN